MDFCTGTSSSHPIAHGWPLISSLVIFYLLYWVVRQTYVTKIRIALFDYPLAVSIDSQRYRGTLKRRRQSKQTKGYQKSGYYVHRETQMQSHRVYNTYFYFETVYARDENILQDLRRRSERQSSRSQKCQPYILIMN